MVNIDRIKVEANGVYDSLAIFFNKIDHLEGLETKRVVFSNYLVVLV